MADECIVGKVAIVDVVVFNGDKMVGSKLFESLLCLDCFSLDMFVIMWM